MHFLEMIKTIHGKQIVFVDGNGSEYDALVLCDLEKGISIKPLDPETVIDGGKWNINPMDPNFYFYCYSWKGIRDDLEFEFRVKNILSKSKLSFSDIAGTSYSLGFSSCPFLK